MFWCAQTLTTWHWGIRRLECDPKRLSLSMTPFSFLSLFVFLYFCLFLFFLHSFVNKCIGGGRGWPFVIFFIFKDCKIFIFEKVVQLVVELYLILKFWHNLVELASYFQMYTRWPMFFIYGFELCDALNMPYICFTIENFLSLHYWGGGRRN